MSMFKPASKKQSRARIALLGPSGSGKTYTALRLAHCLAEGGRVAYIDTERGSASKYVGDPNPDGGVFEFDCVDDWPDFAVERYIQAINEAGKAGYSVLIIDSLSHAWAGPGGLLEFVDARTAANKGGNSYTSWRDATPKHNALIDAILRAPMHIIATMRVKQEYVLEEKNGKKVPRKVGLQPVQRDGLEYEFDVVLDIDSSAATVSKTRCSSIADKRFVNPGADLGNELLRWLGGGAPPPPPFDAAAWLESELVDSGLPWAAYEEFLAAKGMALGGMPKEKAETIKARLLAKPTQEAIAAAYFGTDGDSAEEVVEVPNGA